MIQIKDKRECCGCSACVQKCPKECILMIEDGEGFLYPAVNTDLCVDCGICEKVCPFINISESSVPKSVFAVKNPNEEERMKSSSGGVFISLAKYVISIGGEIFGAVFDECWEVRHVCAETYSVVQNMMGSKYVQSRIENTYIEARQILEQGRVVLFSGTPCQIAGLRKFLGKDYPNLLTVDFVCHGVPSAGVWRRYLREICNEEVVQSARRAAVGKNSVLTSSINAIPVITGIEFRDKTMHGWKKFSFVVRKESVSKADKNTVLLSDIFNKNPFMKGFLANIYLRPSCYACKCKKGNSHSDITIGDFWGIGNTNSDFDDDKGVSAVMVNTSKGEDYFRRLDLETHNCCLSDVVNGNRAYNESAKKHPKRERFYILLNKGYPISKAVEDCLYIPFYLKTFRFGKRCVRKIIKILSV